MMGLTLANPLPFSVGDPSMLANAPLEPALSSASFLMEKMDSTDVLLTNGPSGDAVKVQLPTGLTNGALAGTSFAPSAITPAQSCLNNFTLVFSAMAAALFALYVFNSTPLKSFTATGRFASAKSR